MRYLSQEDTNEDEMCYLCRKIVRNMKDLIQFIKENYRSRDVYLFAMSFIIGLLSSLVSIMITYNLIGLWKD